MSAVVLNILEKIKPYEVVPARLENFVVSEGESIPAHVILDPNISVYCLDDDTRRVILVETPPEVDLSQAPFYYAAQYEHALRLIAVPYVDFHQLAREVKPCDLICIYSIGRCGSTLISRALNTVDGVLSLSEPDIYTQIHMMRHVDRSRDAEYTLLLDSCTRMLGKNTPTMAIKFRGMCIHIGDLLYDSFPDARNLFLYRHAETWAISNGLERLPIEERRSFPDEIPLHRRSIAPLSVPFATRHGHEASRNELWALMWLSMLDRYLALHGRRMQFLTLRFEDIRAQPKRVLSALFDYCGLTTANVEHAYAVFSKDSQKGSMLSRENLQKRVVIPLEDEDYRQFRAVLREHPVLESPDFILPGTLLFEES